MKSVLVIRYGELNMIAVAWNIRTTAVVLISLFLLCGNAEAHWCTNIYRTYARIVVKPERQNINISQGDTGELRVRVRNNFPYTLRYIKLRANNPSGYSVSVDPNPSQAGNKVIFAGQDATFTLSITNNSASNNDVSALNLEVSTSIEGVSNPTWRDEDDWWINQNPNPNKVRNYSDMIQTHTLHYNLIADTQCNDCASYGVQKLLTWWAGRIDNCVNGLGNQSPMNQLRGGHQLAIRLRWRKFSNPSRETVIQAMIDGMEERFDIGRGHAAFLAAYGTMDKSDPDVVARIQHMADSDSDFKPNQKCSYSGSDNARQMAKAALYILGHDYESQVRSCYANGSTMKRVICAAALGMYGPGCQLFAGARFTGDQHV